MNKKAHVEKKVRDLIIPLTDYPHMPYWATLKEAVVQLTVAQQGLGPDQRRRHVLVFDEAYRLQGILTMKDILAGIEPKFQQKDSIKIYWDDFAAANTRQQVGKPIQEFMSPVHAVVDASDSIIKASHLMISQRVELLPVMENQKVLGVIRMEDLFQEISMAILSA